MAGHQSSETEPTPGRPRPPGVLILIGILIALTSSRILAVAFIPKLEMFGGVAANAWLGPWVVDGILGLILPVALIMMYRVRGPRIWGALLIYNSLGAFDYLNGLLTQSMHPLPESVAPAWLVLGSLVFTLVVQLLCVGLLLRQDVSAHFLHRAS